MMISNTPKKVVILKKTTGKVYSVNMNFVICTCNIEKKRRVRVQNKYGEGECQNK
jgi:hypothetical protein